MSWRLVAALCVVALLPCRAAFAEGAERADARLGQLIARDDALMRECAALPDGASALKRAGLRARLRRLEADYKSYLRQNPRNSRAMVACGGFLADQGRESEAVQWWQHAIAVDPTAAQAYNDLAVDYGHNGRAADALRYHQKAFELRPDDPMYRFNWATTCVTFRSDAHEVYGWDTKEIFRRGLEQFRKARDLAPQELFFANAYAETFYMVLNADWQEAYAAWKFCLDLPLAESDRQFICGHLVRVCIHLKRYDEARTWLDKMSGTDVKSMRHVLERKLAQAIEPQPAH